MPRNRGKNTTLLAPKTLGGMRQTMAVEKRVRELIESRGCEPASRRAGRPDLNSIEEAFAKIKHLLREACARSREALVEAMGAALSAVSARDALGFFEHAGNRPADHLL